ncbi:hypothetical protein [Xenorhabdus bovienii]|nr:hypothetical protein [Xenorhabdus bovienii]
MLADGFCQNLWGCGATQKPPDFAFGSSDAVNAGAASPRQLSC